VLLYTESDQINAVVPMEVRGREFSQMAVEVNGVLSNLRTFGVRETNPSLKVFVRQDGTLEDRGSPLADLRLENGSQNGAITPARRGEIVEIYVTGLDLNRPIDLLLRDFQASPVETVVVACTAGGVQKLRVRIPEVFNGGPVTTMIHHGDGWSVNNAGFVWVE